MIEIWKDVVGYEGWYMVSNLGRVKSLSKDSIRNPNKELIQRKRIGKILSPGRGNTGYLFIFLSMGNNKRNHYLHRLVANAFIGECPIGKDVNHKDGKKSNNSYDNLEYVTKSQNMRHAFINGLVGKTGAVGELNGRCVIKEKDVILIRNEKNATNISNIELAKRYGVWPTAIQKIVTRKTWKHI